MVKASGKIRKRPSVKSATKTNPLILTFNARRDAKPQVISFLSWRHRGGFAQDVASAFSAITSSQTSSTRIVSRRILNAFLKFLDHADPNVSLQTIDDFDARTITSFIDYLEQNYSSRQRRRDIWLATRRLLLELFRHGKRVRAEPFILQITPWPKAGYRGVASRNLNTKDPFVISFAADRGEQPQCLDFSKWKKRGPFGRALIEAFKKLHSHLSEGTRTVRHLQLNQFLRFLEHTDPKMAINSVTDFSAGHARKFKDHLDSTGMIDRTKRKYWATFRMIMLEMINISNQSGVNRKISIAPTPWPGAARRAVYTEPMSIGDAGALLRACASEMKASVEKEGRQGVHYEGITSAELLPFIVILAFWTHFNPDTVVSIKLSDIGAPYLGRMIITAEKGRSNREQVASFPVADTHPCSPSVVIANLLRLTSTLRTKCRPEIRDQLFIGLVLNPNCLHEIEAYQCINSSTTNHYRRHLSKRNKLRDFTLQEIRSTGAMISNALFGNDVKTTQILLNHLSVDMTDQYTKQAAQAAEELSLADQIEKRNRFILTQGARDTRGFPSVPQSAATPGFVCADPFKPPAELRQSGGLCAAYGACPTCPLAGVDHTCPTSFILILRLFRQLSELACSSDKNPHRWIKIWKPRLDALGNVWIGRFEEGILVKAMQQSPSIPMSLPPIDLD